MNLVCGRLSGEPDIVKASSNSPPMRLGARGEGVRALQMALIDLGVPMPLSTGGGALLPDGIFGNETRGAVSNFQRLNGLVVDGVAGAQTIARLDLLLSALGTASAGLSKLQGNKSRGLS